MNRFFPFRNATPYEPGQLWAKFIGAEWDERTPAERKAAETLYFETLMRMPSKHAAVVARDPDAQKWRRSLAYARFAVEHLNREGRTP